MSQVKVLYFASAKDATKCPHEYYKVSEYPKLGDVISAITGVYPGLQQLIDTACLIAVNLEYTQDMQMALKPGDEIALIPPVSGG